MNINYRKTMYGWMEVTVGTCNATINEDIQDYEYAGHLDMHLQAITDLVGAIGLNDGEVYQRLQQYGLTDHIEDSCAYLLEELTEKGVLTETMKDLNTILGE